MEKIITDIILFLSCKILFRVRYENTEILNKYDKCMICSNHTRIFDPAFIRPKVENMYSVGKSDLFEKKYLIKLLEYNKTIPIKRDSADRIGIKNIIKTINDNEKIRLLMFPEGGVFKENYIEHKRKHKDGAIFISATTKMPIIPIHITSRPKFFSKVTVSFGEPFYTNPEVLKDRKILKEESKRLIDYIYEFTENKK